MRTSHTLVAVVGAGPYGLSVSAHLSGRGIEHRVFGRPMSLWSEHMPRGMFLKSDGHASNLGDPAGAWTLARYTGEHGIDYAHVGIPVSIESFVGYGHWFADNLVPHVEQVEVTAVRAAGPRFELELSDGDAVTADRVVLAIGVGAFRRVPDALAGLPASLASHSVDHRNLSRFAGRRVVVLGGGQGALETAALLHESGARTRVLVRADRVVWNAVPFDRSPLTRLRWPVSTLGTGWRTRFYAELPGAFRRLPARTRLDVVRTALGPAGSWWLRERIDGIVPVSVASAVEAATPSGDAVELTVSGPEGVTTVIADHVMAGTGFHVDLSRLAFLDAALVDRIATFAGYPVLDGAFQTSVPGLHMLGLAAAGSFGPVQRFVAGAAYTAGRVAAHAARAARRRATTDGNLGISPPAEPVPGGAMS